MTFPISIPSVVGSVITPAGLRRLDRAGGPADVVEVRVDALRARGVAWERIEAALKSRRHPVLLTLRIPAEGGQHAWLLPERRELFLRLLPHAEAIDVELASAGALRPVLAKARRLGKTIVFSAHSIAEPATPAQLAKWVKSFRPGTRAVLKIAGRIESRSDLQRLASVLVDHPGWQVAVMGVGPQAARSRAALAALGSRLVYGYLDAPAAPGQPSAAAMRRMLDRLSAIAVSR